MPPEVETTQTSEQAQPAQDATVDRAAEMAAAIADSEPNLDIVPEQDAAPDSGNSPEKATPAEEQPAEKVDEPVKDKQEAPTKDTKDDQQKVEPVESKVEKQEEAPATELKKEDLFVLSGLEKPVEQNVDYFKNKYSESSKEAKAIQQEKQHIEAVLKERGIDIVRTDKGLALVANEKYLNEVTGKQIPDVFKELTQEEQDLVHPDVAAKIAKLVAGKLVVARPNVDEDVGEVQLPSHEVDSAFRELAGRKTVDGKEIFAGITEPEITDAMRQLYEHESFTEFRKWANKDADNFKTALNLLHGAAFRVMAPIRVARKQAEAQKVAKQEKNERKLSTASATAAGQTQSTAAPKKRDIASEIAESSDTAKDFFDL